MAATRPPGRKVTLRKETLRGLQQRGSERHFAPACGIDLYPQRRRAVRAADELWMHGAGWASGCATLEYQEALTLRNE
jgi:hypothetical protein